MDELTKMLLEIDKVLVEEETKPYVKEVKRKMKMFKFRGKIYEASDYMQYAALGKDAQLYAYESMPKKYLAHWRPDGEEDGEFITTLKDSEGWEESLVEIDKVLVEEAPAPAVDQAEANRVQKIREVFGDKLLRGFKAATPPPAPAILQVARPAPAPAPTPPRPVDLAYLQSAVKANTDLQWELYDGLTGLRPGTVMKILFDVDMTQHPKLRKPKSVWELKEGDECYLLTGSGAVVQMFFGRSPITNIPNEKALPCHVNSREQGNIFLTQTEAERVRDLRKARAKINRVLSGMEIPEVKCAVVYRGRPFSLVIVIIGSDPMDLRVPRVGLHTEAQCAELIKECEAELKLILDPGAWV